MIKLLKILKEILLFEAILSDHYIERKKQRGKIRDIIIPPASYEGYTRQETVDKLLPLLQSELYKRLEILENSTLGISNKYNVGYIAFSPILKNKGEMYPIKMETLSTVGKSDIEKEYIGKSYVAIVKGDVLVTLLVLANPSDSYIKDGMLDHDMKNNKLNNKGYTVVRSPSSDFIIDINTLFGKEKEKSKEEKIDISSLPYTVRAGYRPGTSFEHKTYGVGKIVAASSHGTRSGEPDARGMVDSIEVDFGKPYLSGGKLQKTRKFNNIYSSLYFKT